MLMSKLKDQGASVERLNWIVKSRKKRRTKILPDDSNVDLD